MKKEDRIEDFDFGFSFADEEVEEVKENLTSIIRDDQQKIEDLEHRLNLLYSSIVPFLDNLCKNPEKSTIHWPNRVEKIQEYKQKLKLIVEGKAR
jgi:DNA repair exonuclease SbcCD ATPase subunit